MNIPKIIQTAVSGFAQFERSEIQEALALLLSELETDLSSVGYEPDPDTVEAAEVLESVFETISEELLMDEEEEEDEIDDTVIEDADEDEEEVEGVELEEEDSEEDIDDENIDEDEEFEDEEEEDEDEDDEELEEEEEEELERLNDVIQTLKEEETKTPEPQPPSRIKLL